MDTRTCGNSNIGHLSMGVTRVLQANIYIYIYIYVAGPTTGYTGTYIHICSRTNLGQFQKLADLSKGLWGCIGIHVVGLVVLVTQLHTNYIH